MPTNLQDIANKAGVSITTVSRALRGNYPIAQETLQRIQAAMSELDYEDDGMLQRNLQRKASPQRHTGNIGLLLGDIFKKLSDPFWSSILDGINEEVRRQKYHIRFTFTRDDLLQEHQRHLLKHSNVDGLIQITRQIQNPITHEIAPEFIITIDNGLPSPLTPLLSDIVEIEKWNAMRTMGEHLLNLGHKHFRFFTGSFDDLRTAGFLTALTQRQIPISPELCISTPWNTEESYPIILSILQQHGKELDALVCASDLIAIAAIRAANTCGLRVPEDIAITGFNDLPFVRDLEPSLTTIAVPTELLGRVAVRRLLERIQQPTLSPIIHMVPTTLVIRRSCGADLTATKTL